MNAQRPMTPDELEANGYPRNFHDLPRDDRNAAQERKMVGATKRYMLANNDKPWRCPAWSRKDLGCESGSLARFYSGDGNANHRFLTCPTCGTVRLPTFGIRLAWERPAWKIRLAVRGWLRGRVDQKASTE